MRLSTRKIGKTAFRRTIGKTARQRRLPSLVVVSGIAVPRFLAQRAGSLVARWLSGQSSIYRRPLFHPGETRNPEFAFALLFARRNISLHLASLPNSHPITADKTQQQIYKQSD
jgi:hypothetical protein